MKFACVAIAALLLLGCAPQEAATDKRDMYLNAGSAPKDTDNKEQLTRQGMDPNTNMSGVAEDK